MCKPKKSILFTIMFILFCSLLTWPDQTMAQGNNVYQITSYDARVDIQPDGSLAVEEEITYQFRGVFEGVYLDVNTEGSDGLKDARVYRLQEESRREFTPNNSSEEGTFELTSNEKGTRFTVFSRAKDEKRTYIFQYKLLGAVSKYLDTAELNRKIIGDAWPVGLEEVKIHITFPTEASRHEIYAFTHGNHDGKIKVSDGKTVELTVSRLNPGTFVEARVLFPPALLTNSTKVIKQNVLTAKLEEENRLAEEEFYQREELARDIADNEQKFFWGNVFGLLLIFLYLITGLLLCLRFGRDPQTAFRDRYCEKPPNNYSPAEVSVVLHDKRVRARDIVATILNLAVRKKLLLAEDNNDTVISLRDDANFADLTEAERYFVNWLLQKIGRNGIVTLTAIKENALDKYTRQQFRNDFHHWQSLLAAKADADHMFDSNVKTGKRLGVIFSLFFISAGVLITLITGVTWTFYLLFPGIVFLIGALKLKRRTPEGAELFHRWQAYKNYLHDHVISWNEGQDGLKRIEQYLPYAVSFGLVKELAKKLPDPAGDNAGQYTNIFYFYQNPLHKGYAYFLESLTETIEVIDKSVSQNNAFKTTNIHSGTSPY